MDIVGLILSLPGTFTSTLECFERLQFGRHFESDFGECLVKSKAYQVHLARWGVAIGIAEEPLSKEVVARLEQHPPDKIKTAHELLDLIRSRFEELTDGFKIKEAGVALGDKERDLDLLDEEIEIENQERRFRVVYRLQQRTITRYKRTMASAKQLGRRTSWALYDRKHFFDLMGRVGELIAELERLFPAEVQQVQSTEEQLSREEARGLDQEALGTLLRAIEARDGFLKDAIEAEGTARGISHEDIKISGYARTRLGMEYAQGSTGPDPGRISYKGIEIGGNSTCHLGNSYGGPGIFR